MRVVVVILAVAGVGIAIWAGFGALVVTAIHRFTR